MKPKQGLFQQPLWVAIFAITGAVSWGWAYPLIKLGFQEFCITSDMTGSKMLFAGIRFFFAGAIILCVSKFLHRDFSLRGLKDLWFIVVFSLLNTTLHYAFFYIGLSHAPGARSAILNSMSVFTVVIFACFFFKSDKMTPMKLVGIVIGVAGILALNLGGKESGHFTWLGDGMIILNALCSASASLLTRGMIKRVDVFVGTGYSLGFGGLLLVIVGLWMDGCLPVITPLGMVYLVLLTLISTVGFVLYNKLLTCNPVGKVAIYNSLIPVVGAVTSCIFVNEPFYWKYVLAGALAAGGIYIINKNK